MVLGAQRTVYGVDLQLAIISGNKYNALQNTTLNEKFKLPNTPISDTYPTLKYYAIGVGGNDMVINNTGYNISTHNPTDAALFSHTPFVIRQVNMDLTSTEQLNYRFKIKETINNIEYYCYYLKVIPTINYRNDIFKITSNDGVSRLSILNMDNDSFLNPNPVNRCINPNNYLEKEYVTKVLKLEFSLYQQELIDVREAMRIKHGEHARLTEIGVCSGIDVPYEGGITASSVQIMYHIGIDFETSININTADEIIRAIEIGGMEPMRI